jgi:glutathione S-transferase
MLAFIATELHKPFIRCFFPMGEKDAELARAAIERRLGFLAERLQGDHLLGDAFTVADAYLYVMLRWAGMVGLDVPEPLAAFAERVEARPAVRQALRHEGLA